MIMVGGIYAEKSEKKKIKKLRVLLVSHLVSQKECVIHTSFQFLYTGYLSP